MGSAAYLIERPIVEQSVLPTQGDQSVQLLETTQSTAPGCGADGVRVSETCKD